MSFLDLYQGDQDQAARMQPNEGTHLPSGFDENLHAAWSDGQLFSQSIARSNARAAVLGDYIDEIKAKTGNDLSKEFIPDVAGGGQTGVTDFDTANARVAKLKESYPELDLAPLSDDEIDKRALAKSQAAHRTYQNLEAGEKTTGGSFGSFLGSAGAAAADPINIIALGIAPETGGASILSAALRWGALAGVSQAAIEAASDTFKEQVQPGYMESGAPLHEIGGAFVGGAVLGGGFKALGNAWTRVKTGAWPTSVRDAGNVIESEANVADSNIFPGVEGEVAHREALVKTIDDILAGRPVDVSKQITPEQEITLYHGTNRQFTEFDASKLQSASGSKDAAQGFYFTDDREVASFFADNPKTGRIIAANLDIKNPKTIELDPESGLDKTESIKEAFAAGHDAVIFKGSSEGKGPVTTTYVVKSADQIRQLPEQLPLEFEKPAPPKVTREEGPRPLTQTADQITKTLTDADHQDAIRADIDRERAMGDFKVPGVDENGNHTMIGVDAAMDQVDAYKSAAEQIQACAAPAQEAAE